MTVNCDGSLVPGSIISPDMRLPFAFLVDSIGFPELFLIFVVVLLLFGPKRLPEIARMLGRITNELQRSLQEFKKEVTRESAGILEPTVPMDNKLLNPPDTAAHDRGEDKKPTIPMDDKLLNPPDTAAHDRGDDKETLNNGNRAG